VLELAFPVNSEAEEFDPEDPTKGEVAYTISDTAGGVCVIEDITINPGDGSGTPPDTAESNELVIWSYFVSFSLLAVALLVLVKVAPRKNEE